MKIKLYVNSVKANYSDDIPKVIEYFKQRGINVSFDISETKVKKQDTPSKLFAPNDNGSYDAVMYMYDAEQGGNSICFNHSKTLIAIWQSTSIADDGVDYTWKSISHELMHTLVYLVKRAGFPIADVMDSYYLNDEPNNPNSNFGQQWKLLKPYLHLFMTKPTYKYFSAKEIVGLKHELVVMLDKCREEAGIPFKINSGLRSASKNKDVGGVSNSAHTRGYAADIACTSSANRWKIITSALKVGFKRIGVGETFVHLDCDPTLPQEVIWTYYK